MADNVLKKEFSSKDLNRLRNIIKGKTDSKDTISVGYSNAGIEYSEGDTWFSEGKYWKIENGIKQNITKFDIIKKSYNFPLFCTKCSKIMNANRDKKVYKIHEMCLDCLTNFETELKLTGKWDEYINSIDNNNIENIIKDYDIWFNEVINESDDNFTESGVKETWIGSNKEALKLKYEEGLTYLLSLKK